MFNPKGPAKADAPLVPSPVLTAPGGPLDGYAVGDHIGGFSGYLRRPKSTSAGLQAMIFGENGQDADFIAVLHLSHYQDLPVKVSVWMIKDKDGRLMSVNGKFPLLAEFVASVRRPAASTAGQTAQFFGKNGPNADAINVLNKSEFLDAFVYVEMQLADEEKEAKEIATPDPSQDLRQEAATRLVPAEAKELKKQQRRAEEATRILQVSGFFRDLGLWTSLGTETDYQAWLETQACCHPGQQPCDHRPVVAFPIPGAAAKRYNFVGLCAEHAAHWEAGDSGVNNPIAFLQSRQVALTQAWARDALRRAIDVPEGYELVPQKVHAWAMDKRITLPPAYLTFL